MCVRASFSYPFICLVWLSVFSTAMVMSVLENRAMEQNMRVVEWAQVEARHKLIKDYMDGMAHMLGVSATIFKRFDNLKKSTATFFNTGGFDGNADRTELKQTVQSLELEAYWDDIIITAPFGKVIVRAKNAKTDDILTGGGVSEAMTGQDTVLTTLTHRGWEIRGVSPIQNKGQTQAVIVLTRRLDDRFAYELSQRFQCNLSFGTLNGVFASALPPDRRQTVDRDLIRQVLGEVKTAHRDFGGRSKTVFYAPVRAANETFCLIVEKDTSATTALVTCKCRKTLLFSLLMSIIISILGMFLALKMTRPIQELKEKAQIIAKENEQLQHEINERSHTEKKLRKNKARLENALDELKQTQAEMIQSEKMTSVEQLAAGVAHEINNPIGFVKSNLNTLAQYYEDITALLKQYREFVTQTKRVVRMGSAPQAISKGIANLILSEAELDITFLMEDIPKLIQESHEGAERIQKIVSSLTSYAHPGEKDVQLTDINECLESTLEIVCNELKDKAAITKDFGRLPPVRCYPQKINQVFTNILVNAAQAIENKGEIIIRTTAAEGSVVICIADTGHGIVPAHLPRIFDPFFTTKEIGKGAGLGLHTARDIIQLHGGSIHVVSAPGRGAVFQIRMPLLPADDLPC